MSSDATRLGLTRFDVGLIVASVAMLSLLVMSAVTAVSPVGTLTHAAQCRNNLRGLTGAWVAAMQDSPVIWQRLAKRKLAGRADLSPDQLDALRIRPDQSALMTAAVFEVWSAQQELPRDLWRCKSRTDQWRWDASDQRPSQNRPDTSWGWNDTQRISYAFDYSAPADASEKRVICADREPGGHSTGTLFKERFVMVAHADGSTAKVPAVPRDAASVASPCTQGYAGPVDRWVVIGEVAGDDPALPPDNIYDARGDLPATAKPGDEFQVGTGSPRRAFVK